MYGSQKITQKRSEKDSETLRKARQRSQEPEKHQKSAKNSKIGKNQEAGKHMKLLRETEPQAAKMKKSDQKARKSNKNTRRYTRQ